MNQIQIKEKTKELENAYKEFDRLTAEIDEQLLRGEITWGQRNSKISKLNRKLMSLHEVSA